MTATGIATLKTMSKRYLGLVKVSSAEAKRMIDDGPLARREFIVMLVREAGGVVEGYWHAGAGDWDIVCLVEMSDDRASGLGAAATLARRAAGLSDAERWIQLFDVDDVAAGLAHMSPTG